MTDGFTRRKEHSKEEIRKAAWDLFSQYGVEKVSMVEIARKAGVAQATIYNHFGSKDALVREFVAVVIEQLASRAEAIFLSEQTFWEKWQAGLVFLSDMLARGQDGLSGQAAVFGIRAELINDPEIQRIRETAQEKMAGVLLQIVQEGKTQGQVRNDISEQAFRFYFRAFMDLFTSSNFRAQYAHSPHLVQDLGSLMIYGMRGRPEKEG